MRKASFLGTWNVHLAEQHPIESHLHKCSLPVAVVI